MISKLDRRVIVAMIIIVVVITLVAVGIGWMISVGK